MKTSRTSRIAAAVLVTFLSSSVPVAALAQDDPVTLQARARFKEGVDFYDKGQYENARLAFLQAYALKKHPAVLLNLAQSTAKANHPLEAAKYFQQFQKEATTATPQQKQDAETGLAEVRQKLGRIEIVAPSGTEITLDEKERLGTAPFPDPIDVDPGSHSLRSSSETVRVTANAGQKVQARFGGSTPAPPPVVAPVVAPPANNVAPVVDNQPPPPPPDADTGAGNGKAPLPMWPGFVGVGVAGAAWIGVIVFAAFKADAQSKADTVAADIRVKAGSRAQGICSSTATADVQRFGPACQTLKDNNDKVDTNATIANVSLGIAIPATIFSVAWLVAVPMVNKKRNKADALPAPSFTPYAGPGNGGFLLTQSF
ncbi:MAG: hypothetical protein JST00_44855 [Deltaproteobacteria bacterium]|nr:hypothetical protein [Deltaproteobacteria bacterium]